MSWPGGSRSQGELVVASAELPLRGEHNALNLCAALSALEASGVAPPALPGVADRLSARSLTGCRRSPSARGSCGSTTASRPRPSRRLAALASFPGRDIVLIGGGQDRGQDYAQLGRALAEAGATVIGVPSTGPRLLAAAADAGVAATRALAAADMEEAVTLARSLGGPGAVILLSPAAPSYDHYRDFEERGERFRALATSHGPDRL